jgi:hypothetical protein
MKFYRSIQVVGAFLVAFGGMSASSQAATVALDADTVFLTSNSPITTGSAATATFEDVTGGVQLKLSLSLPSEPSYYNANTWWINLTSSAASTYNGTLTFTEKSASAGLQIPDVTVSSAAQPFASEADAAGYYDIWFNNFDNTFVNGDSITYLITSSEPGLTAEDFAGLSSTTQNSYTAPPGSPDGNYYTAVEIYGGASDENQLYYLGSTTTGSPGPLPVPLPAAALLFPAGAFVAALVTRKLRRA